MFRAAGLRGGEKDNGSHAQIGGEGGLLKHGRDIELMGLLNNVRGDINKHITMHSCCSYELQ